MIRRRVHGFIARRLSSEEYLGLHLTVGLLVCLLLAGMFGFLAHSVVGEQTLTEFDQRIGLDLKAHREQARQVRHFFIVLTEIGSPEAMIGLTVLVGLALLMRRRRVLALVWMFAMIATALLNVGLKHAFHRDRPEFRDPIIDETTNSFPSGHSMGSVLAFGLLAYFLVLALTDRREKVAVVTLAAALALGIGFSRIYLGAHYFSDVVGGFAVGGAWLSVCVSSIEVARRRAHHHRRRREAANSSPDQHSAEDRTHVRC
jgi:undecaprenyl-diphosphatase